jgi:hypothetical protein
MRVDVKSFPLCSLVEARQRERARSDAAAARHGVAGCAPRARARPLLAHAPACAPIAEPGPTPRPSQEQNGAPLRAIDDRVVA